MLFATLTAALTVAQAADVPQYRRLTLGDGREIYAQVLQTEPTGFKLLVPQGEMKVSFDNLANMEPSTAAAYESQPDWLVYLVGPQERLAGLAGTFKAIPHVTVATNDDLTPLGLSGSAISKALACGDDLDCLVGATQSNGQWLWVVAASGEGSKLAMQARTNHGTSVRNPIVASLVDPADLANAVYQTLDLTTKSTITAAPERPMQEILRKRQEVVKRSYVPLPGYPSLRRGDNTGFALAMATAVPLTAGWVYVVGKNTESAPAFVGLSAVGFYAITVAANQAFGVRGLSEKRPTSLIVAPTAHQGAAVQLTLTR